jgi:molybdopterin-guanine dinucleotide biosynthesis protein A
VPTDGPFLPRDLIARLIGARVEAGAVIACAESLGRLHPVVGLWPVRLAGALRHALVEDGVRRVDHWTGRYAVARVPFAADPFFNVNSPADLARAEAYQPPQ